MVIVPLIPSIVSFNVALQCCVLHHTYTEHYVAIFTAVNIFIVLTMYYSPAFMVLTFNLTTKQSPSLMHNQRL